VRILVTGGTGFIASHLVPALVAEGHEVVALGHDPERLPTFEGVEPLVLDLAGRDGWGGLPVVDAVVHLAQANVPFPDGADALFAVNTASTQRLLEHARRIGAERFVLFSSGSVYGASDEPLGEESPLRATDFYAATKVAAERLALAYEGLLGVAVLRLFVPYGPGQRARMVPAIAERVRGGRPVTLNAGGRPRMNPVFVGDVVRAVSAALASSGTVIANVAGPDVVDVRGLAEEIGRALGAEPVFEEGSPTAAGDIVADTTRLRGLLRDDRLTSLRDGLAEMLSGPGGNA
jgi:nucleoside-diphosphate-sugar epimerase